MTPISQTFSTKVSKVKRHATLPSSMGMVIAQGAKRLVLGRNLLLTIGRNSLVLSLIFIIGKKK